MCTHLAKRGSRYYFRRRVPLALIPHFQRTEIVKALGTSNRSEAERLARLEGCRWDNEFARLQGETVNSLPDYEVTPTGPKLADLHQQWLSNGEKAPKTRDLYVRALSRFAEIVGNDHVKTISRTDCRTFRDALKEQGLSVKTVNNYLAALSSLFTLAVDDETVERNPTEGLSLKDNCTPKRSGYRLTKLHSKKSSPLRCSVVIDRRQGQERPPTGCHC